jgi:hypothetical protein
MGCRCYAPPKNGAHIKNLVIECAARYDEINIRFVHQEKETMMKTIKKIKIGIGIVLVIIAGLFFHYNLPRTTVVQISGTDIKRMDKTVKVADKEGGTEEQVEKAHHSTDVRFINSVSRKGKPMVFRNQDTGWGWPPYFKFDSADIAAEAQAFAINKDAPWVLVKYYGWRLKIFSAFPNVLKLKQVDRDYTHIPIFNIVFFILLLTLVLLIRNKMKKFIAWSRDRKNSKNHA